MKHLLFALIASVALLGLATTGCNTTQQKAAYNTLYSLENSTVAAYDGYLALVVKGTLPTNDVPRVSKAFNTFQAGALVALDGVQYNTNAIAPANLQTEALDLINLINSIKGK